MKEQSNLSISTWICHTKVIFIFSLLLTLLTACSPSNNKPIKPITLTRANTCAVCGMIVLDYPGPHTQIVWKNKKHTYYCDLHEVMPQLFNSIEAARVATVYVQNFDNLKWGSYKNHWMKAKDAIFVVNSHKQSSMGVSYVPFKKIQNAELFQKKYGGKILPYRQITPTILQESEKLMLSDPNTYGPPGVK